MPHPDAHADSVTPPEDVTHERRSAPGIPHVSCSSASRQLRVGIILMLCYTTMDAPGSAYAGILTLPTGTTGAERSARFVRTARAGGEGSGG